MIDLDTLLASREEARNKERELTQLIKTERARLAAEKKQANPHKTTAGVTVEEWKNLKSENSRLRGMIAVLLKDTGLTYKQLGEKLYCSPGRAQQIVDRALRQLRHPSVYNDGADS